MPTIIYLKNDACSGQLAQTTEKKNDTITVGSFNVSYTNKTVDLNKSKL